MYLSTSSLFKIALPPFFLEQKFFIVDVITYILLSEIVLKGWYV